MVNAKSIFLMSTFINRTVMYALDRSRCWLLIQDLKSEGQACTYYTHTHTVPLHDLATSSPRVLSSVLRTQENGKF